jgi:hypothetical protein
MNWKNIWKSIKGIFHNEPKYGYKIGDQFIDNRWKDTVIEIVDFAKDDSTYVRVKFIKINGEPIDSKLVNPTSTNISWINDHYTKIIK